MNILVTVEVETDDAHGIIERELIERARMRAEDAVAAVFMDGTLGDSWSCEAKVRVEA